MRCDRVKAVIVIGLAAVYTLYCLITLPPGPFSAPDSAGYLRFAPIHTLGYPLFLKLLGANGAIIAQPIVYGVALACLGIESLRTTSSALLATAIVAASIVIPDLKSYHASVLTESLFMSGLIGFLAATVRFVREPSWRAAAAAGAIAGATATIRRTALAFLPVLPIIVLLRWRRLTAARGSILIAAALPVIAVLAGERIAARARHGEHLTSLMGRHAFAKAALTDAAPPHPSRDQLRARLEEELDTGFAPIRDIIRRAPPNLRSILTLYYETCLQGPCVAELRAFVAGTEPKALNDVLVQVGFDRIARAPLNFAGVTGTDYASLWTAYKLRHPGTAPALTAFIAANRPLPFEREAFKLNPEDTLVFRPYEPVRYLKPIVMLIGWLTAGFAFFALVAAAARRAPSHAIAVAALASLTAHGCLLFSALFAAGISRFIVSVWPAIMTAVLFGGWGVFGPTVRSAPTNAG